VAAENVHDDGAELQYRDQEPVHMGAEALANSWAVLDAGIGEFVAG